MRLSAAFLGACLAIYSQRGAGACDSCDKVLDGGVFAVIQKRSGTTIQEKYEDLLETATQEEMQSAIKSGLEVTIPIQGVPTKFSGDYSQEDHQKLVAARQEKKHREYAFKSSEQLVHHYADFNLLNTWLEARRLCAETKGMQLRLSATQGQVVLKVCWKGQGDVRVDGSSIVNGQAVAQIPPVLKPNVPHEIAILWTDPHKVLVFTLSTNVGTFSRMLLGSGSAQEPTKWAFLHGHRLLFWIENQAACTFGYRLQLGPDGGPQVPILMGTEAGQTWLIVKSSEQYKPGAYRVVLDLQTGETPNNPPNMNALLRFHVFVDDEADKAEKMPRAKQLPAGENALLRWDLRRDKLGTWGSASGDWRTVALPIWLEPSREAR